MCEDLKLADGFFAFQYMPRNGYVIGYIIPDEIEDHIFDRVDMIKEGQPLLIHDYTKERISYIFYQYDDKDVMEKAVKDFNKKLKLFIRK